MAGIAVRRLRYGRGIAGPLKPRPDEVSFFERLMGSRTGRDVRVELQGAGPHGFVAATPLDVDDRSSDERRGIC